MRPLETGKQFNDGVRFEDIVELYDFDRELRLLCLDAIERIEVALRAHIINIMGAHGGPHFYYDAGYFHSAEAVAKVKKLGAEGKHLSITHYKNQYSTPDLPPIWCLTEASTFGTISMIYADLKLQYRKEIAKEFSLSEKLCVSWFKSLSTLRNFCAHHWRLWNAELIVNKPRQARAYLDDLQPNGSCYARLAIMQIMLKKIDHDGRYRWSQRLEKLIDSRPRTVSISAIGFPEDWKDRPLWNGQLS